jgi:TolB protein
MPPPSGGRGARCIFLLSVLALLSAPVFAQENSRIAFVANCSGNWDLFVTSEDGKKTVQLTATPYDENEPRWSPDRKSIVYSSGNGEINIIDVDTKKIYTLPFKNTDIRRSNPCFSADGSKIVYVQLKKKNTDDTELAVFDRQQEAAKTLLTQFCPLFFPQCSPDGKQIVYTAVYCSMGYGRIIQEPWLVDTNLRNARQMVMTNALCMQPVWSPDSGTVAFSSDQSGNFDIWISTPATGYLEQLTATSDAETNPAWSPDGQKIAYVSAAGGAMKIRIKNLSNGEERILSPFKNTAVECRDVAW